MRLLWLAARAAFAGSTLFAAMALVGLVSTFPSEAFARNFRQAQEVDFGEVALGIMVAIAPIVAVLAIIALSLFWHEIRKAARAVSRRLRGLPAEQIRVEEATDNVYAKLEEKRRSRRTPVVVAALLMVAFGLGIGVLGLAGGARAEFSDATERAEFWRVATGFYDRNVSPAAKAFAPRAVVPEKRAAVAAAIQAEAVRQGVPAGVALRLAHVESRFNCGAVGPRTAHGRARGVLQVLPSSAERLEPGSSGRLTECSTGIRVGVAHMRDCMAEGARTEDEIARCHVGGAKALRVRLRAKAEAYARRYVGLFRSARVEFSAPDASGWLVRGSVAVDPAGRS